MSLRTSYTGTLDTKLAEARTAGRDFIQTTHLASITTSMTAAANIGKKAFTITLPVTYQPQDLRLLGPLWLAFQTGVEEGMASEDLMNGDATATLNTSDTVTTSVDLNFSF